MSIKLELATLRDAAAIAALRMACARHLTEQHGAGTWALAAESEGGVRAQMLDSAVFIVRIRSETVATLRLSTRNPWMGDIGFFSLARRPLYLTSMAVAPRWQRGGIGRECLAQALRQARRLQGDTIRLDTYDGPAGAGEFYRRCGFHEVHRADYNGTPLLWFEKSLVTTNARRRAAGETRRG